DGACSALLLRTSRRNAVHHHRWAVRMWDRLRQAPSEEQALLVDAAARDERSWALAVRICNASVANAAHQAPEALRLARLAVRIAGQCPLAEVSRKRLAGWCEPFLGNSHRVAGDLNAADEAFAQADRHWKQGEGGDPAGLLDATRRLDLKASLLRQRGKFPEAHLLLDKALAASPPEAAARLLIMKATTHTRAGDYEKAIEVLRDAEPRIDPKREPRLVYGYHFSLANNLAHLDRYTEAEGMMGRVELLAAKLRRDLDTWRNRWLRGRICLGLGRQTEALSALTQVREHFERERIPFDFALVSLELATTHQEQGHTRTVRELADGMFWIFDSQKVHEEALAALTLFCQAAKKDAAGADWTRRLVKYLYRAQYNPKLCFEG
ncbi:MAG TPA: tetratricopeptide repeat protein, partial [Thermoanaerobaculia bacterium]|nr:tetratricopeptide repeat protein [Thermoanaerobaculia bacterium]